LKAIAVAWKLSITEERYQQQSCLLQAGHNKNKVHNSDKLTWVPFPTDMFSSDWKLRTTEKQRQQQSCLFW
jgi:hypothetical protein